MGDAGFGANHTLVTVGFAAQAEGKDVTANGQIKLWNTATGELLKSAMLPVLSKRYCLSLSRDGGTIAVLAMNGQVLVIDGTTLETRHVLCHDGPYAEAPAWGGISPDGLTLVARDRDEKHCQLWDTQTGTRRGVLTHDAPIHSVPYSADGRRIVTCSHDKTARVWDATTGTALSPPLVHPTWVYWGEFSEDQRYLLTVAKDASARVWDLNTHELVGAAMQGHPDIAVRFRPRTGEVVSVDVDGQVDVWDWRQSRRLCPPRPHAMAPIHAYTGDRHLEISPDGRFAYVGGTEDVYVVSLDELDQPDTRSDDAILLEAEVLSHRELLDSSTPSLLSNDEWKKRWKAWREAEKARPE